MFTSSEEIYFEISNKAIGYVISALKSLLLGALFTNTISDISPSAANWMLRIWVSFKGKLHRWFLWTMSEIYVSINNWGSCLGDDVFQHQEFLWIRSLRESMLMAQTHLGRHKFPTLYLRDTLWRKKKNQSRMARTTHQSALLHYLESVVRLVATLEWSVDKYSARVCTVGLQRGNYSHNGNR